MQINWVWFSCNNSALLKFLEIWLKTKSSNQVGLSLVGFGNLEPQCDAVTSIYELRTRPDGLRIKILGLTRSRFDTTCAEIWGYGVNFKRDEY